MPIPAHILAVKRPANTVVYVYGKNKDRYGVKKRIGCKYKNGKNYPVNGPTVGHIIDGVYVPVEEDIPANVSASSIDMKDWANAQLCVDLTEELHQELLQLYNPSDALRILTIAILRVCYPGIKDYELKNAYDDSFLSVLLPNAALSKNSVSVFQKDLGKTCSRIFSFMRSRCAKVNMDHHLLVDGTLKSNESKVNSLAEFSRKAKLKGSRDISVFYAFDFEKMEPICSQCFPGNMLDLTAYDRFVKDNGINKGILVGDKGFPQKSIESLLNEYPNLHYLNPIRRSSKIAIDNNMYEFEGVLEGENGFLGQPEPIQYKKIKLKNKNKWLYSFRDPARAAAEESEWLKTHKGANYDLQEYNKKKARFGTIVFESDVDLTPEEAWKTYSYRWQIEIVMRYYKSALQFDETRVHDDYSVIGSEFIDFLSTVITFKLIKAFDQTELFNEYSYKKIMKILAKAKKVKIDSNWELVKMNPSQINVLQKLDLLPKPEPKPKKKRGRPRKQTTL